MFKALTRKLFKAKGPKYAAQGIQTAVNSSPETIREKIAKYSTVANEAAAIVKELTEMSKDGTIDEAERECLQNLVEPLFAKVADLM